MEKNRSGKIAIIAVLLVVVTGISIGYAAMSTTLTINGTAKMDPASWSVKFENLSNTTTGAATATTGTLVDTAITDIDVTLTKPGDSVTYTFDVTNDGEIDAELGTFTKTDISCTNAGTANGADDATITCDNTIYELTYADGSAINPTDELLAGETKNLKLVVSYDASAEVVPVDDVDIAGITATFVYVQK